MKRQQQFGSFIEAIVYPTLLLMLMWTVYWAQQTFPGHLVSLGVRPKDLSSWPGVLLMPLLHSPSDMAHIVNNSIPTFVLFGAIVYYYREAAWKVLLISWLGTGLSVWLIPPAQHAFHIGMSGVDYALFGFLFLSGFIRRYLPLQAITLFVVFVYGSMFWGLFPQKENISWEGHFSGLIIGFMLALFFRKTGPQSPKYQYEIEKEMGIEPPDLEGIWLARQEEYERMKREREEALQAERTIIYHIVPKKPEEEE
jgi:membrane associated rhomboid family serine protease